jgi:hypothetical protein
VLFIFFYFYSNSGCKDNANFEYRQINYGEFTFIFSKIYGKLYFIRIDVSKRNLDCCLLNNGSIIKQDVIVNHQKSIERYLSEICSKYCVDPNGVIICAKYTGMYIYPLTVACQSKSYKLWMEDPTQIKYSSGLQRSKRIYYNRKVAEGKNKMTVLNAIRAKLIARIFAAIRDNNCYDFSYRN